eukprot:8615576-Ditylum_brightwellii.AAC.1
MNNGNNASAPVPSAIASVGSSGALQQSQQSMPGADALPNLQVETVAGIEEEDIPTRAKSSNVLELSKHSSEKEKARQ